MYQSQIASKIALAAHKDQEYGQGVPYAFHLNQVADFVVQMYEKKVSAEKLDKLVAVAYLHDVIEDTDVSTHYLLQNGVDQQVVDAVWAMSKLKDESYEDYIAKVLTNKLATRVKLCDTAANLSNSLLEGNKKRINKYTKQIQLLGGFK